MSRICLDARSPQDAHGALERHLRHLVPALVAAAPEHRWIVLREPGAHGVLCDAPEPGYLEVTTSRGVSGARDVALGAGVLHEVFRVHGTPDVYHALHGVPIPGLRTFGRLVPGLIVASDHPDAWLGSAALPGRRLAMRGVDVVLHTCTPRRDALGVLGPILAPGVLPEALASDDALDAAEAARVAEVLGEGVEARGPWVMVFGVEGVEPVIQGFKGLMPDLEGARLLLVRLIREPQRAFDEAMQRVAALGLTAHTDTIDLPGPPDRAMARLRALQPHVRLAALTALPANAPLSPLELMASGIPCLVPDDPALRTLGAGAARPVLHDPRDWTATLRTFWRDPVLRAEYTRRGLSRARAHQWADVAQKTLRVYLHSAHAASA